MEKIAIPDLINIPIPPIKPVSGWKKIEIKENGESLVKLNNLSPELIAVDSQYYSLGIRYANDTLYARECVGQSLVEAAKILPEHHKLLIWDAWRPLEVQQALFDSYLEKLHAQNPNIPLEEIRERAQTYVSLPSGDPQKPSPHYTGGAVDLTILGPNFLPLDMGTEFDHFGVEVSANYYDGPTLEPGDELLRNNRRLLYNAMAKAGFSGYDEEWWHFDFGNQFDAARTDKAFAMYGPASGANLARG